MHCEIFICEIHKIIKIISNKTSIRRFILRIEDSIVASSPIENNARDAEDKSEPLGAKPGDFFVEEEN